MGHRLGYARVSTLDQHPDLQLDALTAAGCSRVFVDTASGALDACPELRTVLDHLRPGDTLVGHGQTSMTRDAKGHPVTGPPLLGAATQGEVGDGGRSVPAGLPARRASAPPR